MLTTRLQHLGRERAHAGIQRVVLALLLALLPSIRAVAQCDPHQLARVLGMGGAGTPQFGYSVAISADGNTAIVGANNDTGGIGAAYVFVRSGVTWNRQGPVLTPSSGVGSGFFGISVALSSDGNTAAIGAYNDNGGVGAVYIFVRTGAVTPTWTQQGSKLVPTGAGASYFGISVSLSTDGNTALIGAYRDTGFVGAAYAFTRSGTTWAQQGAKITPSGGVGLGEFGYAVSLSADGNTGVIGAFGDNGQAGAAYIFSRSGLTWSQVGPKIVPADGALLAQFGISVSIDAAADAALIGANGDSSGVGACYVYAPGDSGWSQQGPKLVPTGGTGAGNFGWSVALSDDGATAAIGAYHDNANAGAAYIFERSDTTWAQHGNKFVPTGGVGAGRFGSSVALSGDCNIALVGASNDSTALGAAYIFARSIIFTQQPADASVSPLGNAAFSVTASFPSPLTYAWRREGVPLTDGPTSTSTTIGGSATPTLTVSSASWADTGAVFDCVVSAACASVTSSTATLTVVCPADFNNDHLLNPNDIFDFLAAWFLLNPSADFNHTDGVTVQDIFDFLGAWFGGCR